MSIEPSNARGQTGARFAGSAPPTTIGSAIRAAIPPTLIAVPATCSRPPSAVPSTLTVATIAIAATAAPACQTSARTPSGAATSWPKYRANAEASVAIDPVRITQNSVQPKRNAGLGPYASPR